MDYIHSDVGVLAFPSNDMSRICYREDGSYNEQELKSLIEASLDSSDPTLFVDVGANVGYFSRMAALAGHDVLAIEASMRNYFYLLRNMCGFGVGQFLPIHAMAWNENTDGEIFLNPNNCGDNRSFVSHDIQHTVDKVAKRRLDDILEAYEVVNGDIERLVVKIDTQGSDHLVLEGFGRYLDRITDCFVECWPFGSDSVDGTSLDDLKEKYDSMGFDVLPVEKDVDSITGIDYVNLHLKRKC